MSVYILRSSPININDTSANSANCAKYKLANYLEILLIDVFSKIFQLDFCSLKLECEKLAQEKTEIQRQYIMVSFYFSLCDKFHLYFDLKLLNMSLAKINLIFATKNGSFNLNVKFTKMK